MMVAWNSPLLFAGDYLLFGMAYLLYFYGLVLSYRIHRSPAPIALALLHIACLAIYLLGGQPEWSGYGTVFTLMLTSIANQYFRNERMECAACGQGACRS
jgi:hypothetical protein